MNGSLNTATHRPDGRPDFVSEQMTEALRQGKPETLGRISPYAACLLPLLKALGWHQYARELIESLPHFSEHFDLVDLRNVLVNLGYESTPVEARVDAVRPELYPCLFVSRSGDVYVLLEREDDQVTFFDAASNRVRTADILWDPGTAYVFTDTPANDSNAASEPWFKNLLQRFRGMVFHLLGMTLIINLAALVTPLFVMMIYDKVIGAKSAATLPYLVSGVAILLAADLVLRFLRARVLGSMAGRLDYLIGVETFRQLISLPPLFTERSTVAAQLSRLRQFDSVRDFFTGANASIALELPFVFLFIVVIAILAGPIALIPLAMVLIYLLMGALWLPALDSRILRSGKAKNDKQRMLIETLSGRKEIKGISGEKIWWQRFRELSGEAVLSNYRTFISSNIMSSTTQGLMTLSGVAVLGLGTLSVMQGEMSMGALIAVMALVWRVLSPLQSAFLSFSKFEQTLKAIKQLNQLMKLKTERHGGQSGLLMNDIEGSVTVDRVSFRYGPDQDPALLGVSFQVAPGEILAIAGNTGSGKSTLLKLIAGMYRPQAGALCIDGMDVRQINTLDLRRAISYVPQKTKFFHGTIAQNMRLNNALATDEEIEQAARDAGILEDILKLPDGFDTRIGDSTTDRYPPGFLRGLSMARAFLNPARILLLDEPGAALDEQSDQKFIRQLKKLRGKRTIIMVSHRPSHIRLADQVIILDQGSLLFSGPADEAIEKMLKNVS